MRAGHQDDGTDGRAQIVGHVFAEDDRRHGGDARVHAGEGIRRFLGRWRSLGSRGGCPHMIFIFV